MKLILLFATIALAASAPDVRSFRTITCHSEDNQRQLIAENAGGEVRVSAAHARAERALARLRVAGTMPKYVTLTSENVRWLRFAWDGHQATAAQMAGAEAGAMEDATCEVAF